jgi:hypothetical protein
MSSPNSVGIDPASAGETFLTQVVDSCCQTGKISKRGRTAQLVAPELKLFQIDELAEFDGDRPCRAIEDVLKASSRLVRPHQGKMSKEGVPLNSFSRRKISMR